jgi:hypothetical protein
LIESRLLEERTKKLNLRKVLKMILTMMKVWILIRATSMIIKSLKSIRSLPILKAEPKKIWISQMRLIPLLIRRPEKDSSNTEE